MALTVERLREKRGLVLWWPGDACPHPGAARVVLAFEVDRGAGLEPHVERRGGWAVAPEGEADILELARVARSATVLDLESGAWFQVNASPTCRGLTAALDVTTEDALGRPRSPIGPPPLPGPHPASRGTTSLRSGDGRVYYASPVGAIESVWRSHPIYDTEWRNPQDKRVTVFQNFVSFFGTGAPRDKQRGIDTNLVGPGGGLPQGYEHEATGISVVLSAPDGLPLRGAALDRVVSSGVCRLLLTRCPYLDVPLELVVLRDSDLTSLFAGSGDGTETGAEAVGEAIKNAETLGGQDPIFVGHPAPPVFPFGFPLVLRAMEQLEVAIDVRCPDPFFVKVVISGNLGRAQI